MGPTDGRTDGREMLGGAAAFFSAEGREVSGVTIPRTEEPGS